MIFMAVIMSDLTARTPVSFSTSGGLTDEPARPSVPRSRFDQAENQTEKAQPVEGSEHALRPRHTRMIIPDVVH